MRSKITGVIDLKGKVCLVTGASRGIGKGIAVQLAYHGAKCYVTGRNSGTLQDIAKEVKDLGGTGVCVPVQCDHSNDDEVAKVFDKIEEENNGRLDLLVNNAFSAVGVIFDNLKKKFWEQDIDNWDKINNVGLRNHYRCSVYAAKLMTAQRHGLIINVSSAGGLQYLFSVPYGVGKAAKDRMAQDCGHELKNYGVAYISLWPGLVKTEFMDANASNDPTKRFTKSMYERGESPSFVGKAVVALLSEQHPQIMERTGRIILTTEVGRAHGITEDNGDVPGSLLEMKFLLESRGYRKLAAWIPQFVRVPFWLLTASAAMRKVG